MYAGTTSILAEAYANPLSQVKKSIHKQKVCFYPRFDAYRTTISTIITTYFSIDND